jgi:hypothetical protein
VKKIKIPETEKYLEKKKHENGVKIKLISTEDITNIEAQIPYYFLLEKKGRKNEEEEEEED